MGHVDYTSGIMTVKMLNVSTKDYASIIILYSLKIIIFMITIIGQTN